MDTTRARARSIVRWLLAFSVLIAVCIAPASESAEPERGAKTAAGLPTGSWHILANGYEGDLVVSSSDTYGNISGSVFGSPIKGFWDGFDRRVTFSTMLASDQLQVYTGRLQSNQPSDFGFVGTFEAFLGTGATAKRNVYGWESLGYSVARPGVVSRSVTYTALAPMSLSIDANGSKGTLTIASVDAQDNVTGTVLGSGLQGFWDGNQRKLTFIRFVDMAEASHLQIFTGYQTPGFAPGFAGSFEAFSAATAQRNVFGWYATGPKVMPMPATGSQEVLR